MKKIQYDLFLLLSFVLKDQVDYTRIITFNATLNSEVLLGSRTKSSNFNPTINSHIIN